MSSSTLLALLLVSCPLLAIANDSDVRNGRYYDVFNDRQALTIDDLLDAAQVKGKVMNEKRTLKSCETT